MSRSKWFTTFLVVCAGFAPQFVFCSSVQAAFVAYTDSSSFFAALAGNAIAQETYEAEVANQIIPSGGTLNGLTYTFPTNLAGRIDAEFNSLGELSLAAERDGLPGVDPDNDFFFPGDTISVALDVSTRAFGVFINAREDGSDDYFLSVDGIGTVNSGGTREGTFYFVGMISDTPFSTVQIGATAAAPSGYNIDNLSYAIPEPSTAAMLILGGALAAVGWWILHRARVRQSPCGAVVSADSRRQ